MARAGSLVAGEHPALHGLVAPCAGVVQGALNPSPRVPVMGAKGRCSDQTLVATVLNRVLRLVPISATATMMTTAMRATISPYT